jgi:hypothetical protein
MKTKGTLITSFADLLKQKPKVSFFEDDDSDLPTVYNDVVSIEKGLTKVDDGTVSFFNEANTGEAKCQTCGTYTLMYRKQCKC